MARKPTLSTDGLMALGAEKLAALLVEEANGNAALRKRLNAAMAGADGPEAVAKLIDRRLAALERARAMVGWEKEKGFAQDLEAVVASILKELGPLSPWAALRRLLRFVDTHGTVFERIDDSNGRIQDVYWRACDAVPELVARLSMDERDLLPDLLHTSLGKDAHGLAPHVAMATVPLLPASALERLDTVLAGEGIDDTGLRDFIEVRQAIADVRGDLDGYLALEALRQPWRQNPLAAAERLLAAGRFGEALDWVRRERKGAVVFAKASDVADGWIDRARDLDRVRLEARILDAMKDRGAAQAIRWAAFEATLDPGILRDYIGKLDDFLEFEEMDKALAVVEACPHAYTALSFLLEWPRLDLAAKLVLDRMTVWDGRHYDVLVQATALLEAEYPLAATILYRALLNHILGRGKSQAYGHAARYLSRLADLARDLSDDPRVESHATFVVGIQKAHGRKSGFWSQVKTMV
jgi:hypothetical protein